MIMTIAEQIRKEAYEEGYAQGREEGFAEGREDLIFQLIGSGMEKDKIQRVTSIDPKLLDRLWRECSERQPPTAPAAIRAT